MRRSKHEARELLARGRAHDRSPLSAHSVRRARVLPLLLAPSTRRAALATGGGEKAVARLSAYFVRRVDRVVQNSSPVLLRWART